jgi:hypothetical protein
VRSSSNDRGNHTTSRRAAYTSKLERLLREDKPVGVESGVQEDLDFL